jgi:hypothetical protein
MFQIVNTILEPFVNPNDVDVHHGTAFSIDLVALLVASAAVLPYMFYKVRGLVPHPVKTELKLGDYYIMSILLAYLVIGVYQQYFWTKKNKLRKEKIIPKTKLDEYLYKIFGYNDAWIYVYNLIYYLVFGLVLISIRSYEQFAISGIGAIIFIAGLSVIWYIFPNDTLHRMKTDRYLLQKTQAIDEKGNNCCPSAHVVFAMYSFYLLRNVIGYIPALLIPLLISISCIATTQHVATDIILGVAYSVLVYNLILKKIFPNTFR